jgi:sarcosine oxidase subunit alpha
MSTFRTAAGGLIDRSRSLRFSFDGETYSGHPGDTLASALLANGVHLLGRSFKYHRPRGVLSAGSDEPNALVTVWRDTARYTPDLLATQVELYDGLQARSQNRWPSLGFDVGAINNLLSRFIPAGFYYKTFMWPPRAWHTLYEPFIRRAAGLGVAPSEPDPDRYAQRFAHCEVLVVGSGPAGIAAALAAADSGVRVILCDEHASLGGSLRGDASLSIDGQAAGEWLDASLATLRGNPRVTLLDRTTAFGYFPHNFLGLAQRLTDHQPGPDARAPRARLWQVRAREVVLATGAHERPLVFPGNDRPGVMLASAAHAYLTRYGVIAGRELVLLTSNDSSYRIAKDLWDAGVRINALCDVRAVVPDAARALLGTANLRIVTGATALGTRGSKRVRGVEIGRAQPDGSIVEREWLDCDALLMSGGFTPAVHLFSQSRGKLRWNEALNTFVPGESAEHERSAGACRGTYFVADVLTEGAQAGAAAAIAAGGREQATRSRSVDGATPCSGAHSGLLPQPATLIGKAFVDWQNDVTSNDLSLATREGFRSIEHVKRYTTTGMATDQGKTSNINALAIVSKQLSTPIEKVGLTTFRMPYTPLTFGSMAGYARGDLFDPVRKTPTHAWAAAQGAVFEDVGMWKRARYFLRGTETMHQAVAIECQAVRQHCGMFDASTLGKIEVVGPDAAEFLNRLYVNDWTTLAPGRSRYGILLREDGFVYDDGVIGRMASDRFHVTTTTGGAPRVFGMMEDYLQTEWPDLKVWLTSTTEQWAVVAVQGPNARRVLDGLVEGIDLTATAFPHMGVAAGHICGIPCRLFRVSFTGELGFEVNVPADYGQAVWEAIYSAGQPHGIEPYGTEAMHVMRAEKGYIIIGQDTDGTVTPLDAGLGWAIGKKKPDFVGKRALERPAMRAGDRPQFIGLLTADPKHVLEEGAQIAARPDQKPPMELIGYVTSSYWSPALNRSIALGMIKGGRARRGQTVYIPMPGGDVAAEVTAPVFYDTEGARLND